MHFINVIYLFTCIFITSISAAPPKEGSNSDPTKKYLVTNLPGLSEIDDDYKPIMYSGQLELFPENNTNYFFWKFVDSKKSDNTIKKTIFWLNGGPGCSSMDGALLETGPFRINKDKQIILNNGTWHKSGDIIYVDQPAGTGFSYTNQDSFIHDLDVMAFYFLRFMEKYYELFPDELNNDIYFAGESYAGQYIPYIATAIIKRNKNLGSDQKEYKLKGLLIGNGWVSPNEQSLAYLPFFLERGLIDKTHPKILNLLKKQEECQRIVDKVDSHFNDKEINPIEIDSSVCENILTKLLEYTLDKSVGNDQQCINMYDYTLRDSWPSCGMNWPMELKYVNPFLNDNDIKHDLNLKQLKTWRECNGRVGRNFNARRSFPSIHLLPELTKHLPIILFNGDNDIICNTQGVLSYLSKLKWQDQKGFLNDTAKLNWIHDDSNVGYYLSESNLTFINIYNSSHMVPYDLPDVSRALIDIITGNYDVKNNEIRTYPLGVKAKGVEETPVEENKPESSDTATSSNTEESSSIESTTIENSTQLNSTTTDPNSSTIENDEPTSNKITRLIQLAVIIIVIWGIYILYSSYKSRPSSIIKKTSRNKKKNVQWADQLDSFEEEEDLKNYDDDGIFTKAFNKLSGKNNNSNKVGNYVPLDDFIIGGSDDDDEEEPQRDSRSPNKDNDTKKDNNEIKDDV
ncbi:uncharacterized protein KGF55_004405 [Candida pseudojiufengensis]|uniref:uncharacterized protein n=1 Tax=Candida pseudojiufengensis TaxID=497109 RepID=UPI002224200B|nr:uncharacterized protein KGF55_004405 [Candida pseudojiufengensis]KAI5960835.1 hypothetical protein KGF55_004405 [Candida pseudojiufengensis]